MEPRLIGRKNLLRTPGRRYYGPAPVALAGLVAAVGLLGFLSPRVHLGAAPTPPVLTISDASPYIPCTDVPAPPSAFGLQPMSVRGGSHIFRPASPLTAARSQDLFSYYLDSMSREGWTLLGKGDPSPDGTWTLAWWFRTTSATITMDTAPLDKLTVELCPPDPYC